LELGLKKFRPENRMEKYIGFNPAQKPRDENEDREVDHIFS
jgi:hypothetical protein